MEGKMKKRKDYLRLFLKYTRKHKIEFYVNDDSEVDYAMIWETEVELGACNYKLGTKAAYDWLVKAHKAKIESEE